MDRDLIKRIVIAAGGSGGHIYPGLALAHAFTDFCPGVEVHFWGAHGGMENQIVPRRGFKLKTVPIGRLNKNVSRLERLLTLFLLPLAILRAFLFLICYRPQMVIGVGGHASGPLLLASAIMRTPNAIWEPNAIPGLTNRWLSRFVQKSLVVFEPAKPYLKTSETHLVGMPVRAEIENTRVVEHKNFHILIFGGSQGSVAINNVVSQTFQKGGKWLRGIHIIHQTGSRNFETLKKSYPPDVHIEVLPYLDDMEKRYEWADLVICRSGTGTLSELAASGCPSILVPLPTAADNHQQKNAEVLTKAGAAITILQSQFNEESLKQTILDLKNNPEKRKKMSERARQLHKPQAAKKIVQILCGA